MGADLTVAATVAAQRRTPPPALAWLVWGLGAFLYLIAFYQRVAPAVITRELSADFGLSAAALGNLSAFYFYSYVAVQVPTGLLADRWGPRKVLASGAALTGVGTLVFALAPDVAWANAGRLAIGAAGGVAFVSMLKLASHWMPARHFAVVSGFALFIGVMGATLAGAPLRVAVDAFGWRPVMVASGALTLAVAVAIWLVARDDPSERGYASYAPAAPATAAPSVLAQLRAVAHYRNAWLILGVPGAFSAILFCFAGLWGVPFLVTQYGFATRHAGLVASAMLVAWALGGLVYAPISERLSNRRASIAVGLVATTALWSVVILVPGLHPVVLVVLLLALALAAGGFIVVFAFAKESVPAHLAGTVSGLANMGVMLGGMVMQPLVGFMLDRHWNGALAAGSRVYDFAAYRASFGLTFAWCALSLVLLAFMRETGCRQAEA